MLSSTSKLLSSRIFSNAFVVEAFLDTDCRNVTCNSSHLNCKLIQTRDFYNPIAQEEQPQAALHFGVVHKHKPCAYPC